MRFNERQQSLIDDGVRAYKSYGEASRQAIATACTHLSMTYDPTQRTVLVYGLSSDGWFLFVDNPLRVERMADTVRYTEKITGLPHVTLWGTTAAWIAARVAFIDLAAIDQAIHSPTNRVTGAMACFLAMRDRVHAWGGFTGEADELRRLEAALMSTDRVLIAERLAGGIVCGSATSESSSAAVLAGSTPPCSHPTEQLTDGPRVPLVYGSIATQVCACGMWRMMWSRPGPWRPAETLAEALEETDDE